MWTVYPASLRDRILRRYDRPESVDSKANDVRDSARWLSRRRMIFPASSDAPSGWKAESPVAIMSAFTNSSTPSTPRNRDGAVVLFPALLDPPMMTATGSLPT